jgi:hypothetical protein
MTTRRALLAALAAAPVALAQAETGFTPLFNGKNLDGWTLVHGRGPGYVVKDGIIECPKDGGGNLFTEKEYSDFVLRLEWRVWEGSNNGVGIRAPLEGDAAYVGMEIQILDEESAIYHGKEPIKPEQYTGSVYGVFAAKHGFVKRNGVWNSEEIMAKGTKIKVTLNGTVITDVDLATVKDPEVLKKHPGLLRKSGHIGFLGHGTKVEFRNVRIKTLA